MNALLKTLIGTRFTNIVQPYGPYTILIESAEVIAHEPGYGCPMGPTIYFNVCGPVVEGSETGFLWGATSTRDITGCRREVRGISMREFTLREKITIAM